MSNLSPTDRSLALGYLLLALKSMNYPDSVVDDIHAEVAASIDVFEQKDAIAASEKYKAR